MLFPDYVRSEDGKTLTDILRISGALHNRAAVSWKSIVKAGTHALGVKAEVAEKLSECTDGRCSVEELRDPRKHMTDKRRAEYEKKDRERARLRARKSTRKAA